MSHSDLSTPGQRGPASRWRTFPATLPGLLLLAAAVAVPACDLISPPEVEPPPEFQLEVEPETVRILVYDTARFRVTARATDGRDVEILDPPVRWSEHNFLDLDGSVAEATGLDSADVVATLDLDNTTRTSDTVFISSWARIDILPRTPDTLVAFGQQMSLSSVAVGAGQRSTGIPHPRATWSSSNTAAVTVGDDGTVTAVSNDSAWVIATTPEDRDSVRVVVRQDLWTIEGPDTLTALGAMSTFQATDPGGAAYVRPGLLFRAADTSVVKIDSLTGTAQAVAEGSTTVTAQAGDTAITRPVTVRQHPDSIEILAGRDTIWQVGDTTLVTVHVRDARGNPLPDSVIRWGRDGTEAVSIRLEATEADTTRVVRAAQPGVDVWVTVTARDTTARKRIVVRDTSAGPNVTWQVALQDTVAHGVTVLGDSIAIVASIDGEVRALRISDGSEKWSRSLPTASRPSSPAMLVDSVLLLAQESGTATALRTEDGTILWSRAHLNSNGTKAFVLGEDGTAYVSEGYGGISRIDLASGDITRVVTLSLASRGLPAFGPDQALYYAYGTRLGRLDLGSNQDRSVYTGSTVVASPAIGPDGTVFVGSGANVLAFEATSGSFSSRWSHPLGVTATTAPIVTPYRSIAIGAQDGRVYALGTRDGEEAWNSADLGASVSAAPTIAADGTIYAGLADGTLVALYGLTGGTKWTQTLPGPITGSPVVSADGTILVGAADSLFAITEPTGGPMRQSSWPMEGRSGDRTSRLYPAQVLAEPGDTTITATDVFSLRTSAYDDWGNDLPGARIRYESRDTAVVRVSSLGVVTAERGGDTWVVASAGLAADSVKVGVRSNADPRTVEILEDSLLLFITQQRALTAAAYDSMGSVIADTLVSFTWRSSDTTKVSVDAGLLTARDTGRVWVYAQEARGLTDSARVMVGEIPDSVILSPDTVEMTSLQDTVRLVATGLLAGDTIFTGFEWVSRDELVATVDGGLVRSVANGATWVVARSGADSLAVPKDSTRVVVDQMADSLTIQIGADTIRAFGDSTDVSVAAFDALGHPVASPVVEWLSRDTNVVRIPQTTAAATTMVADTVVNDSTWVLATIDAQTDSVSVTVWQAVEVLTVAAPTDTLHFVGDTARLTPTLRDSRGYAVLRPVDLTWSALDAAISVDSAGLVTAIVDDTIAQDSGRVAAAVENRADTAVVKVVRFGESLALDTPTVVLGQGGSWQLTGTVFDSAGRAMPEPLIWLSTDSSVVEVDSTGLLTPGAPGTAYVVAAAGTLRDSALVEVTENGRAVWTAPLGGAAVESGALSGDSIFVVGTTSGQVEAIDVRGPTSLWNQTVTTAVKGHPVVVDSLVFVADHSELRILDLGSGSRRFNRGGTSSSAYTRSSAALAPSGRLFANEGFDEIVEWDPHTGTTANTFLISQTQRGTPSIGPDGILYQVSDYGVHWIDTETGDRGAIALSLDGFGAPAIAGDGTVFVATAQETSGVLEALRMGQDGLQLVWSASFDETISTSPIISELGRVIVGTSAGMLYGIDPTDGDILWSIDVGPAVTSDASQAADGTIYVTAQDSSVYAIHPGGAGVKWRFRATAPVVGAPTLAGDGTLYVTAGDTLYAFTEPTGGPLRRSPWPVFGRTGDRHASLWAARVALSPRDSTVTVSDNVPLRAEATDEFGNRLDAAPATFRSLDPAVAEVTNTGLVQTIRSGVARITVAVGSVADTAWLRVLSAGTADSVDVAPDSVILFAGQDSVLSTTAYDSAGYVIADSLVDYSWTSADTTLLVVGPEGRVSALAPGTLFVQVQAASGAKDSASVTIGPVPDSLVAAPDTARISALDDTTRVAVTAYADTVPVVTGYRWISRADSIVSVADIDLLRGHAVGGAWVVVVSGPDDSVADSVRVEVRQVADSVAVEVSVDTLRAFGDSTAAAAAAYDATGHMIPEPVVQFSSSDTALFDVDTMGVVVADTIRNGSGWVRATVDSVTDSVAVAVWQRPVRMTLLSPRDTLHFIGDTLTLQPTVYDVRDHQVTRSVRFDWASLDTAVVSVDSVGTVRGSLPNDSLSGTTQVVATLPDSSDSDTATVIVERVPFLLAIDRDSIQLGITGSATLQAVLADSGGARMPGILTWTADDTAVAVVDSAGRIAATGQGSTWVRVEQNTSVRDSVFVEVTDAGAIGWQHGITSPAAAAMALSGDTLLLVGNTSSQLVAVNTGSPSTVWSTPISSNVLSQPAVTDSLVVVTDRSYYRAIKLKDGSSLRTRSHSYSSGQGGAAVRPDGRVVAHDGYYNLYEWDPRTGYTYSHNIYYPQYGTAVIGPENRAYLPASDGIYLIDLSTRARARTDLGRYVRGAPAIGADGTVFVTTGYNGSGTAEALSYDAGSLQRDWATELDEESWTGPVIDAFGDVIVGTDAGTLYGIDATDGSVRWTIQLGGMIRSAPAIADDGTIYVGSTDSTLYALGPQGSSIKWRFKGPGSAATAPLIAGDGTVYAALGDSIYSFQEANGGPLRSSVWPMLGRTADRKGLLWPDSVTLGPADTTLTFGDQAQLRAVAYDSRGNTLSSAPVTFVSLDPDVIGVSETGQISAVGVGTTAVLAQAGPATDTAWVTILSSGQADSVTVHPDSILLFVDQSEQLTAAAFDSAGAVIADSLVSYSWSSTDSTKVKVDSLGQVTARDTGFAFVIAEAGSGKDSTRVTVGQVADSIALSPDTVIFTAIGDTARISATGYVDTTAVVTGFDWTTLDDAVATVDGFGLVTSHGLGSTWVRVTSGLDPDPDSLAADSVWISVEQVPDSLVIALERDTLTAFGDSTRATVVVYDPAGNTIPSPDVTWWSRDTAVVRVDSLGGDSVVIAADTLRNGATWIGVDIGSVKDSLEVTVWQEPVSVTIPVIGDTLHFVGDTARLNASARDSRGFTVLRTLAYVWESLDTTTATVDSAGLAEAVVADTITVDSVEVVAGIGAVVDSAWLHVRRTAAGVQASVDSVSVALTSVGSRTDTGSVQLAAAAVDSGGVALPTPILWSLSDSTRATVDSTGLARALAMGTTWIIASAGSGKDSVFLRVTNEGSLARKVFVGSAVTVGVALDDQGWMYYGDANRVLHAHDVTTDTEMWSTSSLAGPLSSTPVVHDSLVLAATTNGYVYAFRRSDGAQVSGRSGLNTNTGYVKGFAVDPNGKIYVTDGYRYVYEYRPETNQIVNEASGLYYYHFSSPTIAPNGRLYVNTSYGLGYYDPTTGANYYYNLGDAGRSGLAVGSDGAIYLGRDNQYLYAVEDANTGFSNRWARRLDGDVRSAPALTADGRVVVGTDGGTLYALGAATGDSIWALDIGAPIRGSAAIAADGTIYVGASDSTVYAVYAHNGQVKWRYKTGGGVTGAPAIGEDGFVHIPSADGYVYVHRGATGPMTSSVWPMQGRTADRNARLSMSRLELSADSVELAAKSETYRLRVAVAEDEFGNALTVQPSWTSGDVSVVEVNAEGVASAVENGVAWIYATGGTATDSVKVIVDRIATFVDLIGGSDTISIGELSVYGALAQDSVLLKIDGFSDFEWSVSDASVAVVDGPGEIAGVGAGSTWVRVSAPTFDGQTTGDSVQLVVRDTALSADSVVVSPGADTLTAVGAEAIFEVHAYSGTTRVSPALLGLGWTVTDPAVATVDSAGVVTAAANGTTKLIAKLDSASVADTVDVVVNQRAAGVRIDPPTDTINVLGDTLRLTGVVHDSLGAVIPGESVRWTSLNLAVVTVVDSTGLVTAVGTGESFVRAVDEAADVFRDSATIVVRQLAASLTVSPSGDTLHALGDTLRLSVVAQDSGGTAFTPAPTWASLDPAVATVDSTGLVTAHDTGGVEIAAVADGAADTMLLWIEQVPASLVVDPGLDTMAVGESLRVGGTVLDSLGTPVKGASALFTSLDTLVARVDSTTGWVTAADSGTARIEAVSGSLADTATLVVTGTLSVDSVRLSPVIDSLFALGDTSRFTVTAWDDDRVVAAHGQGLRWTVEDATVSRVDTAGLVTAVGNGTTQLIASLDSAGVADTVGVVVEQRLVSVAVAPAQDTLHFLGDTTVLTVELTDALGSPVVGATATFSSSDTAVVAVDSGGVATASGVGEALITAVSGGLSDTARVTVVQVEATVIISAATDTLTALGDTLRLSAIVEDSAGSTVPSTVEWSSRDTATATVDSTGLVTAVDTGSARIEAIAGTAADTFIIHVGQVAAALAVSPQLDTLPVGASVEYETSITDARGSVVKGAEARFASLDTLVATVDSVTGWATAVDSGTARITAAYGSVADTATLVVSDSLVVDSIQIAPQQDSIFALGDTARFEAWAHVGTDTLSTYGLGVVWSTVDTAVATVDSTGLVVAAGEGATQVVAVLDSARTDTADVVVKPVVSRIVLSAAEDTLTFVGDSTTITADPQDALGTSVAGATVMWASTDTAVVTVDSTGQVTAVSAGTAYVQAMSETVTDSVPITVEQLAASVTVSPGADTLTALGDTVQLAAAAQDSGGTAFTPEAAWTSLDSLVAAVDGTGLVTAVDTGTARIEAAADGATDTATIRIEQAAVALTTAPALDTLAAGESVLVSATITDALGSVVKGAGASFASLDTLVATVDSVTGWATAVDAGTARITAAHDTLADTTTLVVQGVLTVDSVTVTPALDSIFALGDTTTFEAHAWSGGEEVSTYGLGITWSTVDTAVATVDSMGTVMAVANGATQLVAVLDSMRADTADVVVEQRVAETTVSPARDTLRFLGDSAAINATAADAGGFIVSSAPFTYASRDTTVIRVTVNGQIVAVDAGAAWAMASSGGVADSVWIVVEQLAATVTISPEQATLRALGDTLRAAVTVTDSSGAVFAPRVGWASLDTLRAVVDSTGLITAVDTGTVGIVAEVDGVMDTMQVYVRQVVAAVTVAPTVDTLAAGESKQLSVSITDSLGFAVKGATGTWASLDTTVVTVDSLNGWVTAVDSGSAAVEVASQGLADSATIVVAGGLTIDSIRVDPPGDSLFALGETVDFDARAWSNGEEVSLYGLGLTWSVLNTAVASVDTAGVVTAVANGATSLVADLSAHGVAHVVNLVVEQRLASIALTAEDTLWALQETTPLVADPQDSLGVSMGGIPVSYFSTDTSVLGIDSAGTVTANARGEAYVGAAAEGVRDSLLLTVALVIDSVGVSPSLDTLHALGDTLRLTATAVDTAGTAFTPEAAWTSLDTLIATVDSTGLVTAVDTGTARIEAAVDGATDTATIRIEQTATALAVSPQLDSLAAGESVQLTAFITDSLGSNVKGAEARFASLDTLVATVDSVSGWVTAVDSGTAQVTATYESLADTATVEVSGVLTVDSVTVAPALDSIFALGDTATFEAHAWSAGDEVSTYGLGITWSTVDTAVATLDSMGTVVAVSNGATQLVAVLDSTRADTADVVVEQVVAQMALAAADDTLQFIGDSTVVTADLQDANANTVASASVDSWSSADTAVVTVDSTGQVTAVGTGTAYVRSTAGAAVDSLPITVTQVAASVVVSPSADTLTALSDSLQLTTTAQDSGGTAFTPTAVWTSLDTAVAMVDSTGLVTAVDTGTARIEAAADGATDTATIRVEPVVAQMALAATDDTLQFIGDSTVVTADLQDSNGYTVAGATVDSWTSADTTVVTVDSTGEVTAVGTGTAYVRAASGAETDSMALTVMQVAASVTVSPPADTMTALDDTLRLTVAAQDSGGVAFTPAAAWTSLDTLIATVDSTGLATAVDTGNARIEASADGATDTATIRIEQTATALAVSPQLDSLAAGESVQLTASITDSLGSVVKGAAARFASLDTLLATVDSVSGWATAVDSGTAQLTATYGSLADTATLEVSGVLTVDSVTVTPVLDSIFALGDTAVYEAHAWEGGEEVSTYGLGIAWTTADTAVATVDTTGAVTAVADGSTPVVVMLDSTRADTAEVVVEQRVAQIALAAVDDTLTFVGDSTTITADPQDALGTSVAGATVMWASADTAVVKVDSTGQVTAVSTGTAYVRATSETVTDSLPLTVTQVAASVVVSPSADTLHALGETVQLTATAVDTAGTAFTPEAAWTSLDTLIATVDSTGLVTALDTGTARIEAAADGAKDTATIRVEQVTVALALAPQMDTIPAGASVEYEASITDSLGSVVKGAEARFASLDTLVATVDSVTGWATGVDTGSVQITAVYGVFADTATLVVSDTLAVDSIRIAPAEDSLFALGDTARYEAYAHVGMDTLSTYGLGIAWSVVDTAVATVDSTGLVTAVADGATQLVAVLDSTRTDTAEVVVEQVVAQMALAATDDTLQFIGDSTTISADPQDALGTTVAGATVDTWVSADTLTVTVDSTGQVVAVSTGSAYIRATSGAVTDSLPITVTQMAAIVTVSPTADTLTALGDTLQLMAAAQDSGGTAFTPAATWTSLDTLIATVDSAGLVTAVDTGTVQVEAVADGAADTATVRIEQVVAVVAASPSNDTLTVADSVQITATVEDSLGNAVLGAEVTWTSSDTSVATVDSTGLVTAIAEGTAEVTAVSGGVTDTVSITVISGVAFAEPSLDESLLRVAAAPDAYAQRSDPYPWIGPASL